MSNGEGQHESHSIADEQGKEKDGKWARSKHGQELLGVRKEKETGEGVWSSKGCI